LILQNNTEKVVLAKTRWNDICWFRKEFLYWLDILLL